MVLLDERDARKNHRIDEGRVNDRRCTEDDNGRGNTYSVSPFSSIAKSEKEVCEMAICTTHISCKYLSHVEDS